MEMHALLLIFVVVAFLFSFFFLFFPFFKSTMVLLRCKVGISRQRHRAPFTETRRRIQVLRCSAFAAAATQEEEPWNFTCLRVSDSKGSLRFYQETFGMRIARTEWLGSGRRMDVLTSGDDPPGTPGLAVRAR